MDPRLEVNRANWDDRVPIHAASAFYDVAGWLASRPGVRPWERPLVGDVAGLDVVHLQCHFGLDTLALADEGARVTGLDFSGPAVERARALAEEAGLADRARFVQADVLDAAAALAPAVFDLVYISLGSLTWLPSVDRWASQVAALTRPGGRVHLHDGHPLSWALADDELVVTHTWFEEDDPYVDEVGETYAGEGQRLAHARSHEWNHSIGEVVTALVDHGLVLERLEEHDWTVYPRFEWLVPGGDGRWHVPPDRPRLPLSFSLRARRPA